jgi:tetratricopeptide (TPR) repeat protein
MEARNSEIQELEDILRQNPDAPVFARLASLYLESGEYLHALALCDRATGVYPEYATVFLLRAAALEGLEKHEESVQNYKKVLEILPRCSVAGSRIEELNPKSQDTPSSTPSVVEPENDADTIEELAERLKGYKPIRAGTDVPKHEAHELENSVRDDLPIVSETLATIFFKQNQFDRAIEAYRQLIKRNPEKADVYFTRIKEIEEAKKSER